MRIITTRRISQIFFFNLFLWFCVVTTLGDAENVEFGYENGCNDYITKPINNVELVSKIDNLIGE